jgi:hypothetical protein
VRAGEVRFEFDVATMLDAMDTERVNRRALEQLDATCTEIHRIVQQQAASQPRPAR